MFGTLRYVPQGSNGSYVTQVSSQRAPRRGTGGDQHLACERCRAKKLKCSGQKTGCTRCKAASATCTYLSNTNSDGSKRRAGRTRTNSSGSISRSRTWSPTNESSSTSATKSPTIEKIPTSPTKAPKILTTTSNENIENNGNNDNKDNNSNNGNNSNKIAYGTEEHLISSANPTLASQCNLIDMPDWPTTFDATDNFDMSHFVGTGFIPDEDIQIFDADFSMSQFLVAQNLDFDTSFDSCRITDDSTFNLDPLTDSIHDFSVNQQLDQQNSLRIRSLSSPSLEVEPVIDMDSESVRRDSVQTVSTTSIPSLSLSVSSSHDNLSTSQSTNGTTCQCLQATVSMLEEIETKIHSDDGPMSIDTMMNFHQEALLEATSVLLCGHCSDRSERMMLLAMVCEKLTNLCQHCVSELERLETNLNSASDTSLVEQREKSGAEIQITRMPSQEDVSPPPFRATTCGEYKIKLPKDWVHLMKVLIYLQLQALNGFLKRMKMVSFIARRETHLSMLNSCELRVQKIGQKIGQNLPRN